MSTPAPSAPFPTTPAPTVPMTTAPPPAAPPRPNRKMLYLAAIVAIVVVVILVAVFLLPSLVGPSSSSSSAGAITYSAALPIANGAVSGFAGGGWVPLFAAGLVTATSETFPVNTTALGNLSSECTYVPQTNLASLTLPAFSGNRSAGLSPAWEFGYRNASDTLAIVSVINGKGTVLATLSGTYCSFFAGLIAQIPGNVIDSSQAAADAQPYAASFLAAHPNASALFGLIGGVSLVAHAAPEWTVAYSTCTLGPSASGTGAELNVTLNATSGKVLKNSTTSDAKCSSGAIDASPSDGGPAPLVSAAGVRAGRSV